MNDLEAMKHAAALGNAFQARDDVIRAYALAFKGYDATLMGDAVEYAVENCERLPTVKGVIAMYRKAEQLARVESTSAGVECAYCRAAGGWTLPGTDRVIPEIRQAVPPYLPGIVIRDDSGMALGAAWGRLPACASHGLDVSRKQGHGGYERSWVTQRIDDLREWRDRWEAEHACAQAKRVEDELARSHPAPSTADTRAFVAAAVSAPIPASADAVAPDFQYPKETDREFAALASDVPPMTPDEEAEFNSQIKF